LSWSETTLGPHIDLISGSAFKSRYFTDDPSDVPLVKGENIGQGLILWEKSKYWPRGDADGYEKIKLQPGDVVLAMDRPWVTAGLKYAVINECDPEALLVQRVARLRGENGLNSQFLRYIIASPQFCAYAKNIMGGTNVPHISGNQIRAFRFKLPSIEEQRSIASILSAYDDLIENNRRRIQLLEQAAQLLYKEWFVHLRFPGHEHVKIKDGVPDGWGKKSFSELATFLNGFAFKPAHLGDVGLPIVKIPELRDGPTVKTPRNTGEHIPEKYLLNNGDILFSWSATLLVNIWNHGKGLLNQHLFKVTPVSANLYGLVYFALKQALVEFQNQTTGATMKHIRKGALEKVAPLIPNAVLLDEFEVTVAPMLEQISVLQRQTTDAVEARDLLLPRLMNGEVAV